MGILNFATIVWAIQGITNQIMVIPGTWITSIKILVFFLS